MSLIKYLSNIFVRSPVVNGATAVAHELDCANTLSTAGANLLRLSNNADVMMDFSFQGGIDHVNSGASTAAHSQSLNLNWLATGTETSSGQYSCVIGNNNKASGLGAVCLGNGNVASNAYALALGEYCTASGSSSFAIGEQCQATTSFAGALGVFAKSTISGMVAIGGYFTTAGDSQSAIVTIGAATTDATQTTLLAYANTRVIIPADTTWAFSALIVARSDEADGNNCAIYKIEGGLKRDESSNTALVGTPTVTVIAEDTDAIPWSVDAVADDTNEALSIRVTGEAATNIRWVAKVDIAQVTYA